MAHLRAAAGGMVALLVLVACGGGGNGASPVSDPTIPDTNPGAPPSDATSPDTTSAERGGGGPAPALAEVTLRLRQVARLSAPLAMATRPGDERLFVAEKGGRVQALEPNSRVSTVLDLSGEVSTGGEQGLLGLAFSPDGGTLYVNYTDRAGDTRVVAHPFGDEGAGAGRELLAIDQPFSNHNGGHLAVDEDGLLWITTGDGGGAGDPRDNAQDLGSLLGKILRIDPVATAEGPYGIPEDNPFVDRPGARPEVWALGLRNPWRMSFDAGTGDLWIADVGQASREEIDLAPASRGLLPGANYGWNRLEGSTPFRGRAPEGAVAPVFDYARSGGNCAVTGGYVYRGQAIADLAGAYLFGDFCAGRLRALRQVDSAVVDQHDFDIEVPSLSSFGQDAAGEVYLLSLEGPVYQLVAQ